MPYTVCQKKDILPRVRLERDTPKPNAKPGAKSNAKAKAKPKPKPKAKPKPKPKAKLKAKLKAKPEPKPIVFHFSSTPTTDHLLEKIWRAAHGTRFQTSARQFTNLLHSREVSGGEGVYGIPSSSVVDRFVARDTLFDYNISNSSDVADVWTRSLLLSRENTRKRASSGATVWSAHELENIARVFADVCFFRFVYEDMSTEQPSRDVTAATEDALIVRRIISTSILGGERIDALELLRLFAMF